MTSSLTDVSHRVSACLRDVMGFPAPHVLFKDITPLFHDAALLRDVISAMAAIVAAAGATDVVGIESRGFLFGVPIAQELGLRFSPARKPGKLPWHTLRESYDLEYGSDALEMHADAIPTGSRVAIIDDVLATGGTLSAAARLVGRLGGEVVAIVTLVEVGALGGRQRLQAYPVTSLVQV